MSRPLKTLPWQQLIGLCLLTQAAVGIADDLLAAPPVCRDRQLVVKLFAAEPDIVTPIGLTVDRQERLWVIESHTHMPDADYSGPASDRIKVFWDDDGDGRSDGHKIFHEGFDDAMNLRFSPQGDLYVCHRAGIARLRDTDGDLQCDRVDPILKLETRQSYAHSCLLSLSFDHQGWLYVSRGNTGGYPWAIVGTDGQRVSGYGDGGNIVRCRLDGGQIEEYATGFWNPFDIEFDRFGRLFCVDNDPDSRGPNRLLDVVRGGDYGFVSRFGPTGLHPFSAWNGELPGTLPMISATGEAPAAVLPGDRTALPEGYRDQLLATSWGEHTIEKFALQARGVSLTATREIWLEGDDTFRPVGLAASGDGAVYCSDWVAKDYPNHGQGRIWCIRPRASARRTANPYLPNQVDHPPHRQPLTELLSDDGFAASWTEAQSSDPFLSQVAIQRLTRPAHREALLGKLASPAAAQRVVACTALAGLGHHLDQPGWLNLLRDESVEVRRATLRWLVKNDQTALSEFLIHAARRQPVSAALLRDYLAAREALGQKSQQQEKSRKPTFQIRRQIRSEWIDELLLDQDLPADVLITVLALVREPERTGVRQRLHALVSKGATPIRRAAAWTLMDTESASARQVLRDIAADRRADVQLRADAWAALGARQRPDELWRELISQPSQVLQFEAVRAARTFPAEPEVIELLESLRAPPDANDPLAVEAEFALCRLQGQLATNQPKTIDQWTKACRVGGDIEAGRRVFFDYRLKCATCHVMRGRGGGVGPDLSVIGRSATREQLVQSILLPSEDIAPQFQGHVIYTEDGKVWTGIQFHFRGGGKSVSMILNEGGEVRFGMDEIESYQALNNSLMPEGLVKDMTVRDLRNLTAFLSSLQ